MYKIAYILPYFGRFPKNFNIWLKSCEMNFSIDWIIFTDDETRYNYPINVKVYYMSFEKLKNIFQSYFDFKININRPWKLCDFKPAYGEIFSKYLKNYDFWGYCDIDLIWGDIRRFITDDILNKYNRIGFQGHSTLYKNDEIINSLYKYDDGTNLSYKVAFSNEKGYCFDENGMDEIYKINKIKYYNITNFAHLRKFDYNFFLGHFDKSEDYKNYRQIFIWKEGRLYRKYLYNKKIFTEEFMYIHFWCRPMTYKIKSNNFDELFIYSDVVTTKKIDYDNPKIIKKYGKKHPIRFYLKAIIQNRKKISIKRIIFNLQQRKKDKIEYENKK